MSATPTTFPSCVQPTAISLAAQVGCGQDVACGCNQETFLAALQPLIAQLCPNPEESLQQAQALCVSVNPSLLHNRRATLIIPIAITEALAILAVILRFYARHISKLRYGVDDWLAVGAIIFGSGACFLELYGIHNGEAQHSFMVPYNRLIPSNKCTIATNWTGSFAILFLKLSILALYLRLFDSVRKFAVAVYGVAIFTIIMSIAMALLVTLQCRPVAYYWNKAIPGGKCLNFTQVILAVAAVDIVTGAMILLLPLPMLWGLQMSFKKKLLILGLFAMGSFTCVAGALRIPFILNIDIYDISYSLIELTIFSGLEVNVGIISVCLPALRPVFGDFLMRSGLSNRSGGSGSGPRQKSDTPDQPAKVYRGDQKSQNSHGIWAASKDVHITDSKRNLSRKSSDEVWPMETVGGTKGGDVNANSGQNSLKDKDTSIV